MSGGKGGSQTSEVTVPQYIEDAARRNLSRADDISSMGYVPEYGPTVAAFTPMQQAGFQNVADSASAFGMAGGDMSQQNIMGGMDAPTEYAGGVSGYSSQPIYQGMIDELAAARPGQYDYINSFFIDPVTGQAGNRLNTKSFSLGTDLGGISAGGGSGGPAPYSAPTSSSSDGIFNTFQGPNPNSSAGYGVGGYTSFGDMFDGGGPGVKGGDYSGGGGLSSIGNFFGGNN